MRYLPMSFDTQNKTVLIIGGETVALDRIRRLLESEFKIYVIWKDFIEEIMALSHKYPERLKLKKGVVTKDFVFFGYNYLIIATNDIPLNQALEERALKSNIPYERCDVISLSDLLMNRVISKEGLTIGITTNGVNPTITDIVYEDIYNLLANYNEEKILILNKIRRELIKKNALNIDATIRELYETEKINLDSYLKNLEDEEKDKDNMNKDEERNSEIINEKINEIKNEINTEAEKDVNDIKNQDEKFADKTADNVKKYDYIKDNIEDFSKQVNMDNEKYDKKEDHVKLDDDKNNN